MENVILNPPLAFLIYIVLVTTLYAFGRILAGSSNPTPIKTSIYSSGEQPPSRLAAPGYRPFFVVALFFAILHLGVLVLGSNNITMTAEIYLLGLMLVLAALILG